MSALGGLPLSVVIATRDRPVLLDECLDSLDGAVAEGDEVIVVDSCSTTSDIGPVVSRHGARLVRCMRPGASLARNAGWRAACHDVVAFVDDDVRVLPQWAGALRAVLVGHPETSFVTGRLGLGPGCEPVERPVAFLDDVAPRTVDRGTVRDVGHGANLAVRRTALEAVNGFDEDFGPGARFPAAEDLDLLDRMLGAGLTGRYEPQVAAWHLQWRTRRSLVPLEWSYGTGQGARMARLWVADRGRARAVLRGATWEDGIADLLRCVRGGYEFGALLAGARLAGAADGAWRYATCRSVVNT